jgi:hypothetical protein
LDLSSDNVHRTGRRSSSRSNNNYYNNNDNIINNIINNNINNNNNNNRQEVEELDAVQFWIVKPLEDIILQEHDPSHRSV